MAGERRWPVTLADVRKAIATSTRMLADTVTDGLDPAGSQVRLQLYVIADRYECGENTGEDAETLVRLHAWVMQLTADCVRKENRNDA